MVDLSVGRQNSYDVLNFLPRDTSAGVALFGKFKLGVEEALF